MSAAVAIVRDEHTAAALRRAAARCRDSDAARRMLAAGRPCQGHRRPVRCEPRRAHRRQPVVPAWLFARFGAATPSKRGRRGASVFQAAFSALVTVALPAGVQAAGTPIEVWHQDEARVGQQGTLAYVRADKRPRPTAPKNLRYKWAHVFGAICPARGVGAALVLPYANTAMMNLHLAEISTQVAPGAHAVLVLDGAGWHQLGGQLRVPGNITLLHQPPYSPELSPVENVWQCLRQNHLSNRVFETYDAVVTACCEAWNALIATPN